MTTDFAVGKVRRRLILTITGLCVLLCADKVCAQRWYQVHVRYDGKEWAFPYAIDHFSYFDFNEAQTLQLHRADDEGLMVPFKTKGGDTYDLLVDSLTFSDDLTDWGKNKYKVFAMNITTDDGSDITSKETYKQCYVSVDGMGEYPDLSAPAKIRGRGNSTWLWYDKKPYRIKFDSSTKLLGINKNKDWVLLANYRDVTDMMNVYASITAKWMGIPYTTPVRFAEVFLNGEYIGIYQIAEQVEVGGNRVNIDEEEGLLLTLDVDDGPSNSPDAGDNFSTKVYKMPMAVKHPKDLTQEQLNKVRDDFAVLENAIKAQDYELVDSLMDIPSFIAMLQLQEYLYNVELTAPRSIFLFRDKGGKYTFGPAWDWDAGFDFNWGDMYTGHTFFTDYRETLFGTDPVRQNGSYHNYAKFFTDLFGNATFVKQYKERWAEISDSIYTRNWEETQLYVEALNEVQQVNRAGGYSSPQDRETMRWPLRGFNSKTETEKMKKWLQQRLAYINELVAGYPVPEEQEEVTGQRLMGTLQRDIEMSYSGGYHQSVTIQVAASEVAQLMGVDASRLSSSTLALVPLDADGSEGTNTAAGTYGAWFDADGNTVRFNAGEHVFIESNDLFSWNCGLQQNNCRSGEQHTVRMQYRFNDGGLLKLVNVEVHFTITGGGWWW